MLVTPCKAYPEQFSLAPLLLGGLGRWVTLSRVRRKVFKECEGGLDALLVRTGRRRV